MTGRIVALLGALVCAGMAVHLSGMSGVAASHADEGAATTVPRPGLARLLERAESPAAIRPVVLRDGRPWAGVPPLVAVAPFVPTRLEVTALGLAAPIDPLGLDDAGALEVPEDGSRAGWWEGGSRAGERGPAVVVGHVDHHGGEAGVFHALRLLRPGDVARLVSQDGTFVEYVVARTETFRKEAFPTAAVYGPTPGAELRLVTCGGPFNPLRRQYRDNVVVSAALVGPGS